MNELEQNLQKMKTMEIAGYSAGAVVTGLGLLLWSPIISGWNGMGILITLVGLIGFGGFAKNKWY